MKFIIRIALFIFLMYILIGVFSWAIKKAVFVAAVIGGIYLIIKFFGSRR